jgi:hypothetical protein
MSRISTPVSLLWATLALAGLVQGSTAAAELNARDIMEKNYFASKVKSLKTDSYMALINDKGQKRERKSLNQVKLQPNGIDSKLLVQFSLPNDIKGTGFLQIEHSEADDDQWIYLPALKKSRRLVANNKKDSFVGSDFSYGDISLPKVNLYRHTLLRSEVVDAHECYAVESVPVDDTVKANSGYSRKVTWVRADDFLEAKVEYYDLAGRLLKTQIVKNHKVLEPDTGRGFALYREMTNHQTGHKTILRFDRTESGVEAADELFTTRSIERE